MRRNKSISFTHLPHEATPSPHQDINSPNRRSTTLSDVTESMEVSQGMSEGIVRAEVDHLILDPSVDSCNASPPRDLQVMSGSGGAIAPTSPGQTRTDSSGSRKSKNNSRQGSRGSGPPSRSKRRSPATMTVPASRPLSNLSRGGSGGGLGSRGKQQVSPNGDPQPQSVFPSVAIPLNKRSGSGRGRLDNSVNSERSTGNSQRGSRRIDSGAGSPIHSARDSDSKRSSSRRPESMDDNVPVVVPTDDDLMKSKQLPKLADEVRRALQILRLRHARLEHRIANVFAKAVLPFQVRRAKTERAQLAEELGTVGRDIKRLSIMSQQLDMIMEGKDKIFGSVKTALTREIAELRQKIANNLDPIREGYIERISLLQRYWPWRQLLALGDTSVGGTFAEELARGPRYRNVGIQNNIQSEHIEHQLKWLEDFAAREDLFKGHVQRLDTLMEDLADINELIESTLTCSVCGLLFEDPVILWPCGHTFCYVCFESLSIAPSLFRCSVCGSMGSEGFVHNILLAETVAKWMFKDSGYDDLQGPLNSIRMHLARFERGQLNSRIDELRQLYKLRKQKERREGIENITYTYRAY